MEMKSIFKLAERMIENDDAANKKLKAMDEMFNAEWNLPKSLAELETSYKVVSSEPADALATASSTYSSEIPRPTMLPLGPDPENMRTANKVERSLMWAYWNADKRSETRLTRDALRSALRYDKVCIQVIHLPNHYDSIKESYKSLEDENVKEEKTNEVDKRKKAALRKGDFILAIRNPQNVHAQFSELGLERVLLVQEMRASDIVARWGDYAGFLKDKGTGAENEDWGDLLWNYYDYEDFAQRAIWVAPAGEGPMGKDEHIILDEPNPVPFLSWSIRVGGTTLDAKPEHKVTPYLDNVYKTKSWHLLNTLKTLYVSEGIKYAAGPRIKTTTPTGEGLDIEYGGTQASIDTMPGEEAEPWMPPPIDQALMEIFDRTRADIDAQTRVRVLQNPDFPAGTAFATINALLKTTLNGLAPWRELAEMAFADMYELMLLWVSHTGRPLAAYGMDKTDVGEQYTVYPEDFSPERIYLSVSLKADVATDKIEELNASVMMHERLKWPKSDIYEKLGEQDPQKLMRDRIYEDFRDGEIGIRLNQRNMIEQMKLQMQMQPPPMEQQAAQQAQQMGQTGLQPEAGGNEAAFAALAGQGFNPAAGGMPPASGFPEGTREELTGMDMSGQPKAI